MVNNEIRTEKQNLLMGMFVEIDGNLYIEYKYKGRIDYIAWNSLVEIANQIEN